MSEQDERWERDPNWSEAIHTRYGGGYTFFLGSAYHVGAFLRVDAELNRLTERQQDSALLEALEKIAAVEIEDDSQPLYAAAAAHAECVFIARTALDAAKGAGE